MLSVSNFEIDEADAIVSTRRLSPSVNTVVLDHVICRNILLPGVSYIEMAFAFGIDQRILRDISFVRPYVILELGAGDMRATNLLRYTR